MVPDGNGLLRRKRATHASPLCIHCGGAFVTPVGTVDFCGLATKSKGCPGPELRHSEPCAPRWESPACLVADERIALATRNSHECADASTDASIGVRSGLVRNL